MPSQDSPNQYHLIGEYLPLWFITGLMLFGVACSIIAALLLLTPELSMEMLKPRVSQSNPKETVPISTPPVIDNTAVPMVGTAENLTTEQIDSIQEVVKSEAQFPQNDSENIVPPDATSKKEVSVEDGSPNVDERKDAHQPFSLAPDESAASALRAPIVPAAKQVHDCTPLFTVTFNRGSLHPIEPDLNVKAERLQEWINHHPETVILIEGYTDSSGPEELNLLISHRRAKVVSKLLAGAGIADNQMAMRAFGENTLAEGIAAESAINRRVSLRVEGAVACRESTEDGEVQ